MNLSLHPIFSIVVMVGAIAGLLFATFGRNKVMVILFSITLPVATGYLFYRGFIVSYVLLALCIILVIIRIYKLIQLKRNKASLSSPEE